MATGRIAPEKEMTADTLRERFNHIPEFVDKMEISSSSKTRWHVPEHWATRDVALPAAKFALAQAGKKLADVDLILSWARIHATTSPPAASVGLQHRFGAKNAKTCDIGWVDTHRPQTRRRKQAAM